VLHGGLSGMSGMPISLYRTRNVVERFFNKIKQCRRVATRYDKLANYRQARIHTTMAAHS
jgi:transposase